MKYKINEFSKMTTIPKSTLRYYDREKLLIPSLRDQENGYREFTETDQQDLKIILALKELDFSIKEINYILRLKRQPISTQCNHDSTELLTNKINYIEQKMAFYEVSYQLLLKLRTTIKDNNYTESQAELFALIDQLSNYGLKEIQL